MNTLPEWSEDLRPGSVAGHDEFVWLDESLTAALARMEALRDVLQAIVTAVPFTHMHAPLRERAIACIASCERGKEAGR